MKYNNHVPQKAIIRRYRTDFCLSVLSIVAMVAIHFLLLSFLNLLHFQMLFMADRAGGLETVGADMPLRTFGACDPIDVTAV